MIENIHRTVFPIHNCQNHTRNLSLIILPALAGHGDLPPNLCVPPQFSSFLHAGTRLLSNHFLFEKNQKNLNIFKILASALFIWYSASKPLCWLRWFKQLKQLPEEVAKGKTWVRIWLLWARVCTVSSGKTQINSYLWQKARSMQKLFVL